MATDVTATELVSSYVDIWNDRAYSEIPTLVSDSFVLYDPAAPEEGIPGPAGEVHGREGLRQFIEMATTGFPDFEITITDMVADDGIVVWEGEHGGTHEGTFAGLPPTGREFATLHASVVRVEDGMVQRHRAYFDPSVSAEQLGMTFPSILFQVPRIAIGRLRSNF